LTFNWTEYLSVAEALCGMSVSGSPAGHEARQRAAVSRAYYAAYVSARNRLRDGDGIAIPTRGNPHQFVAESYQQDPDPRRTQIGIELSRVRVARNRCDYDDVVTGLPNLVRRSLARASEILSNLGRL
jgi:hypothetical protein